MLFMLFQRYGFLLYTTGGSNLELMFRNSKEDPQPCEHSNPCDVFVATPRGCTYREHTGTRQGIGLPHHETWSDVAIWKYSLSHVDCLNAFLFGIEMASGLPFYSVYSLHLFCRVHVRCNLCIFSGVWQCLIDLAIEGRTATSNSSNHLLPTFLGDVPSQNGSFFRGPPCEFLDTQLAGPNVTKTSLTRDSQIIFFCRFWAANFPAYLRNILHSETLPETSPAKLCQKKMSAFLLPAICIWQQNTLPLFTRTCMFIGINLATFEQTIKYHPNFILQESWPNRLMDRTWSTWSRCYSRSWIYSTGITTVHSPTVGWKTHHLYLRLWNHNVW